MTCKCGARMNCYKSINDPDSRMVHRYHKCPECGRNDQSVELTYETLEEADIANISELKERVNYLRNADQARRRNIIRWTALEIVYGKKKK